MSAWARALRGLACAGAALLVAALPVASVQALRGVWFEPSALQSISSRSTAPGEEPKGEASPQALSQPTVYEPPAGSKLPYPAIRDNTLSAAAFADVLQLLPPRRPGAELLLLDVGAGRSDAAKRFVEASVPGCRVVAADPYNRSAAENAAAQLAVERSGGADVATSMSVLNVVKEPAARAGHIGLLHDALRPGGLAIFKVWAGFWPERGTAQPTVAGDAYQANAWASAFLPEVGAVFGKGRAYAANDLNLIVAVRSP